MGLAGGALGLLNLTPFAPVTGPLGFALLSANVVVSAFYAAYSLKEVSSLERERESGTR
jgi:hypothetical protein